MYEEDLYFKAQDKHFWFKGRKVILQKILSRYLKGKLKILDIGCGAGFSTSLVNKKEIIGLDKNKSALFYSRLLGIKVVQGDAILLPFKDGVFDFIFLLDLLEHVEDDRKVLKEVKRVGKKGGLIIITVPAFKKLWSKHDEYHGHYRRYSMREITEKLRKENLRVLKSTYFNFFLFPLIVIAKKFEKRGSHLQRKIPPFLNEILSVLFAFESCFLDFGFPFGVSILCVVQI